MRSTVRSVSSWWRITTKRAVCEVGPFSPSVWGSSPQQASSWRSVCARRYMSTTASLAMFYLVGCLVLNAFNLNVSIAQFWILIIAPTGAVFLIFLYNLLYNAVAGNVEKNGSYANYLGCFPITGSLQITHHSRLYGLTNRLLVSYAIQGINLVFYLLWVASFDNVNVS